MQSNTCIKLFFIHTQKYHKYTHVEIVFLKNILIILKYYNTHNFEFIKKKNNLKVSHFHFILVFSSFNEWRNRQNEGLKRVANFFEPGRFKCDS